MLFQDLKKLYFLLFDTLLALVISQLLIGPALAGDFLLLLGFTFRIGADSVVGLLVDAFQVVSCDTRFDKLTELTFVGVLALILQQSHVVGNVLSEDAVTVGFSAVLLGFGVVSEEAGLAVGDVDSTIGNTLHNGEDLGTSAGTRKSDVEDGHEGVGVVTFNLGVVVLSVDLVDSLVEPIKLEGLQVTAGEQKSCGIGSGVVGETNLDAVTRELVGIGRGNNNITNNAGVGDLKPPYKTERYSTNLT